MLGVLANLQMKVFKTSPSMTELEGFPWTVTIVRVKADEVFGP
jgi:hypothetical protein